MVKIKFCGMTCLEDIDAANQVRPDYVGFVFAAGRRRTVTLRQAEEFRKRLSPDILAVGVFVDDPVSLPADLLSRGVIDLAQLHGHEDGAYLARLRSLTHKPLIQAYRIQKPGDVEAASNSGADYILLDAGTGGGVPFDWELLRREGTGSLGRPYFLAGGLCPENVGEALSRFRPYAVDVSSGIETDGRKDLRKMEAFACAVRKDSL